MDTLDGTNVAAVGLQRVDLFRDLHPADLELLAGRTVERRYHRDESIFAQGDRGDGLYIVKEGRVAISRLSRDGNELVLTVCESGDSFGELSLFDGEPRSAGAQAVDASLLLYLSRTDFETFVREHPAAMLACLRAVVKELRRCTDLADDVALLGVRGRLARRLLRLAEQSGDENAAAPLRLKVTQQQLAGMTGATRESVNKNLRAMEDDGLIRLARGQIEIESLEDLRWEA